MEGSAGIITIIAILAGFGAAMLVKLYKPEGHAAQFAAMGIVLVAVILYMIFGLRM